MVLKGIARWKSHPEFISWGNKTIPLGKGEGYFSQVNLAAQLGWHPRTVRYALQELAMLNLITWNGDEYGCLFKILVEPRQFDHRARTGGGVDHHDPQLNNSPRFLNNSYLKQRYIAHGTARLKVSRVGIMGAEETKRYVETIYQGERTGIPLEAKLELDKILGRMN